MFIHQISRLGCTKSTFLGTARYRYQQQQSILLHKLREVHTAQQISQHRCNSLFLCVPINTYGLTYQAIFPALRTKEPHQNIFQTHRMPLTELPASKPVPAQLQFRGRCLFAVHCCCLFGRYYQRESFFTFRRALPDTNLESRDPASLVDRKSFLQPITNEPRPRTSQIHLMYRAMSDSDLCVV